MKILTNHSAKYNENANKNQNNNNENIQCCKNDSFQCNLYNCKHFCICCLCFICDGIAYRCYQLPGKTTLTLTLSNSAGGGVGGAGGGVDGSVDGGAEPQNDPVIDIHGTTNDDKSISKSPAMP